MFSSFSSFTISLPRFLNGATGGGIDIQSVDIHDVEARHGKRARTLKHLLKSNHVNHSIVYHHLQFHNHMPHILGSAYILGAEAAHLTDLYEKESEELESWEDSPNEVSKYDWRDYLGNRLYQRAYVDFFEDEMVLEGYDWRKIMDIYLFQGKNPLINCVVADLGHPLIHLGYAYELSSREIAMEALGHLTTSYNYLHKYTDDISYTKPSTYNTTSVLEILDRVAADRRFDGLFVHQGAENLEILFRGYEDLILEHWNAWLISDPKKQFEDSQYAAASLLAATSKLGENSYDFFLVHVLTTSHAIRILLPLIPAKFHLTLIRQWWLLTLTVYIAQLRPPIEPKYVSEHDLAGKNWNWVDTQAIEGIWATDAHFVKALRALKEAAHLWGDGSHFFLKAAVKFGEDFDGWKGFGPRDIKDLRPMD